MPIQSFRHFIVENSGEYERAEHDANEASEDAIHHSVNADDTNVPEIHRYAASKHEHAQKLHQHASTLATTEKINSITKM